MVVTVGYWDARGRAESIRLVLKYAGVNFEDKRYAFNMQDRFKAEWFTIKNTLGFDFPNLPYLIDGDVKLTQTLAILRYLGRKHKLEGNTEAEKNRVAVFEQQVLDQITQLTQIVFIKRETATEQEKADFVKNLEVQLGVLDKVLGGNWSSGTSTLTYVDFWLYEYLHAVDTGDLAKDVVQKYPNLKAFLAKFEALPQISAYLKEVNAKKPF